MGDHFGQGHGLGFGDRLFAGAFQDAVPGIRAVQGAGPVQGRTEPAQQGGLPELDVADRYGTERIGRHGCLTVRMVAPITTRPRRVSSGTEPGAAAPPACGEGLAAPLPVVELDRGRGGQAG